MAEVEPATPGVARPRSCEDSVSPCRAHQRPNRVRERGFPARAPRTRQEIVEANVILEQRVDLPWAERTVEQNFVPNLAKKTRDGVTGHSPGVHDEAHRKAVGRGGRFANREGDWRDWPQEPAQRRVAEHLVAVPGPLRLEEKVEVVSLFLREQMSKRIWEHIVGGPSSACLQSRFSHVLLL